jgi:ATP-dependent helicase Lhr and Lhr-like helicase
MDSITYVGLDVHKATIAPLRSLMEAARSVIVDEIHAIAPNKRGAHLALSLERLAALCGDRLLRIGLSATQNPIDAIADLLAGAKPDGTRSEEVRIIDTGHERTRELTLEVPGSPSPASAVGVSPVLTQVRRLTSGNGVRHG